MSTVQVPKNLCEEQVRVVDPYAEGIHVWPFDPAFPIDVRFLSSSQGCNVRKNRNDYFELVYMCTGSASLETHVFGDN